MKILATGNSMFPNVLDGQYYQLETDMQKPIQIGDIIVFMREERYICHRVIGVYRSKNGKSFYKTKGDNCSEQDSWAITEKDIVGRIELI